MKKSLHQRLSKTCFDEREIWFCSIGINIGHEQDGKHRKFERPVLVFKKINEKTFLGIPLTSQKRKGAKYFYLEIKGKKKSTLLMHQIRMLDAKRLQERIDRIPPHIFKLIKEKFTDFLNTGN